MTRGGGPATQKPLGFAEVLRFAEALGRAEPLGSAELLRFGRGADKLCVWRRAL